MLGILSGLMDVYSRTCLVARLYRVRDSVVARNSEEHVKDLICKCQLG